MLCRPLEHVKPLKAIPVFDTDQYRRRFSMFFNHNSFASGTGSLEQRCELVFGFRG